MRFLVDLDANGEPILENLSLRRPSEVSMTVTTMVEIPAPSSSGSVEYYRPLSADVTMPVSTVDVLVIGAGPAGTRYPCF